ncbi:MAG: ribonuclease T2 [Xanthobacteraceae bacterium]|nr:ribonuclease T2 [Xanthobacteraceae bacterium]QYK44416.1 MAG: ribonuclease T2 [Xanthobacteraceae bacterium]
MRRLLIAAAFLLAASSGQAQQQQYGEPGQFDFYVLALSWSPSYCESAGNRADPQQCSRRGARPYAFVVHGLWPQYERGFPSDCVYNPPYVPNQLVNSMLDVMPSRRLVIYQWRKHGTCSGLNSAEYFALMRKAFEKVKIPPKFAQSTEYQTVSPPEVENAFRAANPKLEAEMIAVTCDRRNLREVRICLTKDLEFRSCPQVDRQACRNPRIVLPPVRGG